MKISSLELFPICVLIEFTRIAFPVIVLLRDEGTDFAQEERLDLPYWTVSLAICVVAGISKYLDILTLEI